MANEKLKTKLEQAYRILFREGVAEDTTRGHITAKAEDGTIYIKPWGVGFEEVGADDFLGLDAEGKLIEGTGRIHSEIRMHLEIYRRRQDIHSITHVHPYHAVLLSAVFKGELYIVSQQGMHFGGGIPLYESAVLIHTWEEAEILAGLMGDKNVILMRNHGIVTAGRTIEEMAILTMDFEKAAKEHLAVSLLGKPVKLEEDVLRRMNEKVFNPEQYAMLWDYYCRKVGRLQRQSLL